VSRSIWATLGVPASSDIATIRKAYAEKLKLTNPEDDPDAFMELRAAYEAAMQRARNRKPPRKPASRAATAPVFQPEKAPEAPQITPEPASNEPESALNQARTSPETTPKARPSRPSPPDPEAATAAEQRQRDAAEFEALTAALRSALKRPWGSANAELRAQTQALLAHRRLDDVTERARFELWFARLIGDHLPQSDPLIEPAMGAFGWAHGPRLDPAIARVLHRTEEWRLVNDFRTPGNPDRGAFQLLNRPPRSRIGLWLRALWPGIDTRVRKLIELADWSYSGLSHWFDPDVTAWFRERFERPHVTLATLLLIPWVIVQAVALDAALGRPPAWVAVVSGLVALVAPLLWVRGIERVRWRLHVPPRWMLPAWLGLLAAAPALSAAIGPGAWPLVSLVALAAQLIVWIESPPLTPRPGGSALWTGWVAAVLVGNVTILSLPAADRLPWIEYMAAVLLAFSMGVASIERALDRLRPLWRFVLCVGVAVLCLGAALGLKRVTGHYTLAAVLLPLLAGLWLALANRGLFSPWKFVPLVIAWAVQAGVYWDAVPSAPKPPPAQASADAPSFGTRERPPYLIGRGRDIVRSGDVKLSGSALPNDLELNVTILDDGSVGRCTAARSSGDARVDGSVCAAVLKRARFTPARGPGGKAEPGVATLKVTLIPDLFGMTGRVQVTSAARLERAREAAAAERARADFAAWRCPANLPVNAPVGATPCGALEPLLLSADLSGAKGLTKGEGAVLLTVGSDGAPGRCTGETARVPKPVVKPVCALLTTHTRFVPARWTDARPAEARLRIELGWVGGDGGGARLVKAFWDGKSRVREPRG
jgi:hypothetical protein